MNAALVKFYARDYDACTEICSAILAKDKLNEPAWLLKMRALTEQAYNKNDFLETKLSDIILKENCNICASEQTKNTQIEKKSQEGLSQSIKPCNLIQRPPTGALRINSTKNVTGSVERIIRSGKSRQTGRTRTALKSRAGTASMLPGEGEFIHIARLNVAKYAKKPEIAKCLFEYLYYVSNDIRTALNLSNFVSQKEEDGTGDKQISYSSENPLINVNNDSWWSLHKAKCFLRLGLLRDAETKCSESMKVRPSIEAYVLYGAIALRFGQPLRALKLYDEGLQHFPGDIDLLSSKARVYEDLNQMASSIAIYRTVVSLDPGHFEALASIGAYHFYEEQPEVALNIYKRILHLGFQSAELYNNLALCAFYAQQLDSCFAYVSQALQLCTEQNASDVYFNVAHIAIGVGDLKLANQALRIALSYESIHPEAYNNLAVISEYRGNLETAKIFYETACQQAPEAFESHHNLALLSYRLGDLQTSYQLAKKTLNLFPNNANMLQLVENMSQYFKSI